MSDDHENDFDEAFDNDFAEEGEVAVYTATDDDIEEGGEEDEGVDWRDEDTDAPEELLGDEYMN